MSEVQELVPKTETTPVLVEVGDIMMNVPLLQQIDTMATRMATAKATIPKHLAGNEGDCFAIIMQSIQWGMNPYVVAQKTHIVNGTLGYEAQLVNAVVQASGMCGRFHYEYKGEGQKMECRVGSILKGEKEVTWGEWLCIAEVKVQNSPLWKTNPKQQIGYLQIKNWSRAHCPGAILGVYTNDELGDSPILAANTEKDMGAAQVVETAAEGEFCSDEKFEKKFPAWQEAILEKGKTPGEIIAYLRTKDLNLSPEQTARIEGVGVVES